MKNLLPHLKSKFEYYAAKLECAVRIAEMLKKEQPRLSELEHEVYWLLGARKTKEEKHNFMISTMTDFESEYTNKLEKSIEQLDETKALKTRHWAIFFNDYGCKDKKVINAGGERVEVEFKEYFTIDAPSSIEQCVKNAYTLAEIVPDIADSVKKLSIKTGDNVSFKIPVNPMHLYSYVDNFVVYYQRKQTGAEVRKAIEPILKEHGINADRKLRNLSGFDFKSEFSGLRFNGSYTQLISTVIAAELIKSRNGSPGLLTERIITRKTQLSKLSPEEMVRALEGI